MERLRKMGKIYIKFYENPEMYDLMFNLKAQWILNAINERMERGKANF
jgi:hypothetical protein